MSKNCVVHVYGKVPGGKSWDFETWSFYRLERREAWGVIESMKYQPGVDSIEIKEGSKPFKSVWNR